MDFDTASPRVIAGAIAEEIGREVDYLLVESDGARKAAERIAYARNPQPCADGVRCEGPI